MSDRIKSRLEFVLLTGNIEQLIQMIKEILDHTGYNYNMVEFRKCFENLTY